MKLIEILQADYQKFPLDQTYTIYAKDVYFQDPMNSFRGIKRYRKMIGFIRNWFRNPHLELHEIKQLESNFDPSSLSNTQGKIITRWTLSWHSPLPWQPKIVIPGWSELEINSQGLISSHVDYWDCSIWHVLSQHLSS